MSSQNGSNSRFLTYPLLVFEWLEYDTPTCSQEAFLKLREEWREKKIKLKLLPKGNKIAENAMTNGHCPLTVLASMSWGQQLSRKLLHTPGSSNFTRYRSLSPSRVVPISSSSIARIWSWAVIFSWWKSVKFTPCEEQYELRAQKGSSQSKRK